MAEIRTACEVEPALDGLPEPLRSTARVAGGELVLARSLAKGEAKALRLALDDRAWRACVDDLVAQGRAALPAGLRLAPAALATAGLGEAVELRQGALWHRAPLSAALEARLRALPERLWNRAIDRLLGQQSLAASFPITLWGAVLDGLKDGDEVAFRKLCELYRAPIERMLRSRLPRGDAPVAVEDFVGWLFAERLNRHVRLRDDLGRGFWFRGFLKRWVLAYARSVHGEAEGDRLPDEEPEGPRAADPFDRALADELIARGLGRLRRDAPKAWRATVLYGLGFTWKAIGREADEGLSTAFERAKRHWAALGEYLRAHLLRDLVPTPAEAAAELAALEPELAQALARYIEQHALDVLARALASQDPVAVAAAARSAATLGSSACAPLAGALAAAAATGPPAARASVRAALEGLP